MQENNALLLVFFGYRSYETKAMVRTKGVEQVKPQRVFPIATGTGPVGRKVSSECSMGTLCVVTMCDVRFQRLKLQCGSETRERCTVGPGGVLPGRAGNCNNDQMFT